jgi:hypothetical protein
MFQHPGLRVHTELCPLVPVCVETAGREHQQWRPETHYFIMRYDAIDVGGRHWLTDEDSITHRIRR